MMPLGLAGRMPLHSGDFRLKNLVGSKNVGGILCGLSRVEGKVRLKPYGTLTCGTLGSIEQAKVVKEQTSNPQLARCLVYFPTHTSHEPNL